MEATEETEREEKSNIVPPKKMFFIFDYVYIIQQNFDFVKDFSKFVTKLSKLNS